MTLKKNYDVGYGKAPKHSQWKKGQSGNPSGRPKKRKQKLATVIENIFCEKVKVVENGVARNSTVFEIVILQLWLKVTSGNRRALRTFYKYQEFAKDRPTVRVTRYMSPQDAAAAYERMLTEPMEPYTGRYAITSDMTAKEAAEMYEKSLKFDGELED